MLLQTVNFTGYRLIGRTMNTHLINRLSKAGAALVNTISSYNNNLQCSHTFLSFVFSFAVYRLFFTFTKLCSQKLDSEG